MTIGMISSKLYNMLENEQTLELELGVRFKVHRAFYTDGTCDVIFFLKILHIPLLLFLGEKFL